MWVVKIGGSLGQDPLLTQWLALLTQLGAGRVVVVPGGGGFADEARRLQGIWHFDDLAAHNMAVLAMAQTAYQLHALNRQLHPVLRQGEITRVLHSGQTALWMPFELQRHQPDERTHWGHTADSIALDLARALHAERLVLVKACPLAPHRRLREMSHSGVLDPGFAAHAEHAPFPIHVLRKDELEQMRALLLGEGALNTMAPGGIAGPQPERWRSGYA